MVLGERVCWCLADLGRVDDDRTACASAPFISWTQVYRGMIYFDLFFILLRYACLVPYRLRFGSGVELSQGRGAGVCGYIFRRSYLQGRIGTLEKDDEQNGTAEYKCSGTA